MCMATKIWDLQESVIDRDSNETKKKKKRNGIVLKNKEMDTKVQRKTGANERGGMREMLETDR